MFEDAEAFFRKALALGPNLVEAYFELGRALWLAGRRDEAKQVWIDGDKANKFNPWGKRCRELLDLEVDWERGSVIHDGRETWVRAYPLPIDVERMYRAAGSEEVAEYEEELLKRRRDHLIIRVDRADLSKKSGSEEAATAKANVVKASRKKGAAKKR